MRLVIPSRPGEHRFPDTQTVRRVPTEMTELEFTRLHSAAEPSATT